MNGQDCHLYSQTEYQDIFIDVVMPSIFCSPNQKFLYLVLFFLTSSELELKRLE